MRTHEFSSGEFKIHHEEMLGLCCHPDSDGTEKSITISPKLKGLKRLDVVIHESLHAEFVTLRKRLFSKKGADEEEWVDDAASNIASFLWRMGYRRKE